MYGIHIITLCLWLFVCDDMLYVCFRWYGGIGIPCVVILTTALYYMGILFGLCGQRPGYDAPCCNRGTGSNFLVGSVYDIDFRTIIWSMRGLKCIISLWLAEQKEIDNYCPSVCLSIQFSIFISLSHFKLKLAVQLLCRSLLINFDPFQSLLQEFLLSI